MSIEKIWTSKGRKEENFVVIKDDVIYKLRVKEHEFSQIQNALSHDRLDDRFVGLPLSYVSSIEYRENQKDLKFNYNQESVDLFRINEASIRKEVFDHIKEITNGLHKINSPNFFQRSKGPLLGLLAVIGIASFVFGVIALADNDLYLESEGLLALLIGLAELGIWKNIGIFLALLAVAIFQVIRSNKKNKEDVHTLELKPKD